MFLLILHPELCNVEQDSIPYVWQAVITLVPIKVGVVHPYRNRFFDGSGKGFLFPAHNVEVFQCCDMACCRLMAMYR